MREILFKAKRISDGEWVSGGSFITFFDNGVKSFFMPQFNEKCTCEHDEITDDILSFSECRFYKVDPETICQFTGLLDKNGNKIWENDIVSDGSENRTYKVMYDEENLCLAADNKAFNKPIALITLVKYFSLTVIGSAIDNPELLKGGSE